MNKKPKLDIPLSEQVLMSTIPYHSIGYEEQVSEIVDITNNFLFCDYILKSKV